ncbi:MAG TPA: hypothetical protein VFT29_17250 [Gemmatimonadaceae bacterium]|nr:hypothetical protein [Gemmatimonadaceae bacterium]
MHPRLLLLASLASLPTSSAFSWDRMTADAGFPPSYNFPVHVAADGRFVALHPAGTWISRDAVTWTRGALPWSGMNSAYLRYIQHAGATWALGTLNGNYEQFSVSPVIRRTSDYAAWETVGRSTTLPQLVFYAATSFRGAMWILGGYNHSRLAGGTPVAFADKLWMVGANRSGRFDSAVLVTDDMRAWRQESTPWSPRGGVAAWVDVDGKHKGGMGMGSGNGPG